MKRRTFLQASTASAALAGTSSLAQAALHPTPSADYYEFRTYRLDTLDQQKLVGDYLEKAAFPAWKRLQIGPVGVFTEIGDAPTPSIHVLLTYSSIQQFADARAGLEADSQYQSAAREYHSVTKDSPAFARIESSFMVAFAGMPRIAPSNGGPRVLELRTYESYSESKARRKVDMFNDGEIPIFGGVGLTPVFFGETLIGPRVPNLKYMLQTDDLESNQAGWKRFIVDPDWVRMRDLPKYADTVSKIAKLYLVPTGYSEI
ncbi:MAG: twin-arginine translocation signal domain-containing protein [Planctomycetes bacterium]|nr:twin-arginine translocation signal domain-containing protein [Planctomycetota bacterium]